MRKGFGRVLGETLPPTFPDTYAENRVVAERLEGFHPTSCKDRNSVSGTYSVSTIPLENPLQPFQPFRTEGGG